MSGAGVPVTLADVLESHGRTVAARMHTGVPAEVVAYDPITNTCTAKIVVDEFYFDADGEREYDELPPIPFVPVMWPRAGGKVIRWRLDPGDNVWLAFSEKSLAEWRTSGQRSQPVDARRHSIGWPVAMPGCYPDTKPMSALDAAEVAAGAMIVGEDGGTQMRIGGAVPGVKFSPTAGVEPISPVSLAIPTDANFAALAAAVTTLTGAVNALITAYNGHTHAHGTLATTCPAGAGTVTGGASSAPSAAATPAVAGPGAPGTTASTLVKSF